MASIGIKDIYNAIKSVDLPNSGFEGLAYGLTYNDSLGLPSSPSFTVLSPFPSLPKNADAFKTVTYGAGKMPIQEAFKAVLADGYKLSIGQGTLFIDFCDLEQVDTSFLTEGGPDSIAEAIAKLLQQVPPNVRPVIRFLRGTEKSEVDDRFWNDRQRNIEAVFYKPDGTPRITHQKAELHVGFYSPNFKPGAIEEMVLKKALSFGLNAISSHLTGSGPWTTEQINALYDTVFRIPTFSASWNHGKIVAIGGKTMMTGGINYWPEYVSTSAKNSIIDMQAKVTGDAAVSAHVYIDYFFKYLNGGSSTDTRSFRKTIVKLADRAVWKTDKAVPIFKDTVESAPKTSGIQVLSVARVGDWGHGSRWLPAYPVQFVDALRDLQVNATAPGLVAAGDFAGLLSTVRGAADTEGVMSWLRLVGHTPAAWASRTARIHAVANARKTVYMSGQMLVGALQTREPAYKALVRMVNKGKPKEKLWDGFLWPYDLLLAFATTIIRLRDTNADPATSGIRVVIGNSTGGSDWGDFRTIADATSKLVPLVRSLAVDGNDETTARDLVGKYFEVRRIGTPYDNDDGGGGGHRNDVGPSKIHTKTLCVDEALLYVGSDNFYPSYNEEHGVWVDDRATVADWVANYWNVLQRVTRKATGDDVLLVSKFPDDVV